MTPRPDFPHCPTARKHPITRPRRAACLAHTQHLAPTACACAQLIAWVTCGQDDPEAQLLGGGDASRR